MRNFVASTFASAALMSVPLSASAETLVYGDAGPNRGKRAEAASWFFDQISEQTGIEIQEQWAGALFKASGAVDGVGSRVADMGFLIAAYAPTEMVAYTIADLPLGYTDPWVLMRATHEFMQTTPSVEAKMRDLGVVYISAGTTTAVNDGCKGTAINQLSDVKGAKIRVAGVYGTALNEAHGAIPVSDSIYNAYQGLDTGLYDCTLGYTYVSSALRWYEQFDSYTFLNWGQFGGIGTFMNADAWDELGAEKQEKIASLGSEMIDVFARLIEEDTAAAIAKLEENDVKIAEISAEEHAALIESTQPYIDEWIARADKAGLDGAALLERFRGLLAKYQAEVDANGHPWDS